MRRFAVIAVVLAMLAVACGGDATDDTTTDTTAADPSPTTTASGETTTTGDEPAETTTTAESPTDAAVEEGSVLWYTAIPVEASEAVAAAFMEAYPGITAEVVRAPSFELWERFRTENAAGGNVADVFSPSDYGVIEEAKAQGYLAEFIPPGIDEVIEPRFIDEDGFYWSNRITTTGLVYNTDLVPADQAPSEWSDLLDPYWNGLLGIGDPKESSAIYGAYWEMANADGIGPEFFQQLAENEPILYAQGGQQLNAVTSGEIAATIVVDYRGWQLIADGAPVEIVYPDSGVGFTLDFNAVAENAPHPNAARLFMTYLSSQEAGDVLARNLGAYLTRPDVDAYPTDVGRPGISDLNLLDIDLDQMAAEFEEFNAMFDEWIGR